MKWNLAYNKDYAANQQLEVGFLRKSFMNDGYEEEERFITSHAENKYSRSETR